MKKIFFMSLLAGAFVLTGCDPVQEEVDNNTVTATASDLLNGISFKQYSDDAYSQEAADGNYITYQTNPGRQVEIYSFRSDGSINIMAAGASGKFVLKPSRGSDPTQKFYIRSFNSDGSVTEAETSLTVYVQQELDPEIRIIASDAYGSKVWKWDYSVSGAVWGNMGYCGGAGADVGTFGNGQWWGCDSPEAFADQTQHTNDGKLHGDESADATMVISDDGMIKCYDAAGNVVRQGSYTIEGWDDSDPTAWRMGMLKTSAGAILWPFEINSGGNMPTEFEIVYLTPSKMTLVYPDGGDYASLGNWGEATYWHFASNSDPDGMVNNYSSKDWTWDYSVSGTAWGNMGYCGGAGADVGTFGNGQWWGCDSPEAFADQTQHTNDGKLHGDESADATMTFSKDGTIVRKAGDGTVLSTGEYSFDRVENNEWKIANLNTTAGSILWPFEINSGGNMPTVFEVVYMTGDKMTLVYPDGGDFGGLGNWGEATYWHFRAK